MPLPSFFQRFRRTAAPGRAATDAMPLSAADVEATRTRARRRLIGMAVLVGAGLIAFPWLFETQPRPMSGDVQIVQAANGADGEVQISGTVPPRSARSASGRVAVSGIVAPADPDEPAATSAGAPPAQTGKVAEENLPARPLDKAENSKPVDRKPVDEKPAAKPSAKLADKSTDKSTDKSADRADKPAPAKDKDKDSAKAKDGKDPAKPADKDKARYVVQFGAFADVNTAHEARMKVERLGLKTYAQQVDTPAGKRIRVRMGPYADKAEADKAMATLRKANLSGAVLTL